MYPAFSKYFDDELTNYYTHDVEKAKAAGRYNGRTPLAIDEEKFRAVCTRWRAGEMTAVAAMRLLGLKPNTFYRRVKDLGL